MACHSTPPHTHLAHTHLCRAGLRPLLPAVALGKPRLPLLLLPVIQDHGALACWPGMLGPPLRPRVHLVHIGHRGHGCCSVQQHGCRPTLLGSGSQVLQLADHVFQLVELRGALILQGRGGGNKCDQMAYGDGYPRTLNTGQGGGTRWISGVQCAVRGIVQLTIP